ncbi:unnamed protein product, partial [Arabidopsis halleri]
KVVESLVELHSHQVRLYIGTKFGFSLCSNCGKQSSQRIWAHSCGISSYPLIGNIPSGSG